MKKGVNDIELDEKILSSIKHLSKKEIKKIVAEKFEYFQSLIKYSKNSGLTLKPFQAQNEEEGTFACGLGEEGDKYFQQYMEGKIEFSDIPEEYFEPKYLFYRLPWMISKSNYVLGPIIDHELEHAESSDFGEMLINSREAASRNLPITTVGLFFNAFEDIYMGKKQIKKGRAKKLGVQNLYKDMFTTTGTVDGTVYKDKTGKIIGKSLKLDQFAKKAIYYWLNKEFPLAFDVNYVVDKDVQDEFDKFIGHLEEIVDVNIDNKERLKKKNEILWPIIERLGKKDMDRLQRDRVRQQIQQERKEQHEQQVQGTQQNTQEQLKDTLSQQPSNQGNPEQNNSGNPEQNNSGNPEQNNSGNPEQNNSGNPEQNNSGNPEQNNSGNPEQNNSGNPEQNNSGNPEQNNSGNPEQNNSGNPEQNNSGNPEQNNSGNPEQNNSGNPEQNNSGNPEQNNSGNPEQNNSGNPEQNNSGNPEQNNSGNPEQNNSGNPEQSNSGNPEQSNSGNPEQNNSGNPEQSNSSQTNKSSKGGNNNQDSQSSSNKGEALDPQLEKEIENRLQNMSDEEKQQMMQDIKDTLDSQNLKEHGKDLKVQKKILDKKDNGENENEGENEDKKQKKAEEKRKKEEEKQMKKMQNRWEKIKDAVNQKEKEEQKKKEKEEQMKKEKEEQMRKDLEEMQQQWKDIEEAVNQREKDLQDEKEFNEYLDKLEENTHEKDLHQMDAVEKEYERLKEESKKLDSDDIRERIQERLKTMSEYLKKKEKEYEDEMRKAGFSRSEEPLYKRYLKLEKELEKDVERFIKKLEAEIPKLKEFHLEGGYTSGRVTDMNDAGRKVRLKQWGEKLYSRLEEKESLEVNLGICLSVDVSGSMEYNMGDTMKLVIFLGLLCQKWGIPFHVNTFGECLNIIKDTDDDFDSQKGKLMRELNADGGCTNISLSVKKDLDVLKEVKDTHPDTVFLPIFITDGEANRGITGYELIELMKGFKGLSTIVGIGINEGYLKERYPNSKVIGLDSASEIMTVLLRELRQFFRRHKAQIFKVVNE